MMLDIITHWLVIVGAVTLGGGAAMFLVLFVILCLFADIDERGMIATPPQTETARRTAANG